MKIKTIIEKELTEFGEFDKSKTVITENCPDCEKLQFKVREFRIYIDILLRRLDSCSNYMKMDFPAESQSVDSQVKEIKDLMEKK